MTVIRRTLGLAALMLTAAALVVACGNTQFVQPGHSANIECGQDGEVHATISNYGAGQYTLNGGTPVSFQSGAVLGPLDGAQSWTLVVTADDWPTWTGQAGPCRYHTTTTAKATTTTAKATTTSTAPPTTLATTTSTAPPPPPPPPTTTTTAPPSTTTTVAGSTSSTTSTSTTTTTAVVPSSSTVTSNNTSPTSNNTPPAPPAPTHLPVTGFNWGALLAAAALVVFVGTMLYATTRRGKT